MLRLLILLATMFAAAAAIANEPLFKKVESGDVAGVEQLLASGMAVDSRARDGATPLIAAALSNQPIIADLLISKGADVMARNSGGFTPLHAAAYSGSAAVAKLLLEKGAVLEDKSNKAGASPLFVAAETNHPEVVELLIAKGADVGQVESHGYMATTRAIFKGHHDMVRLLKRHGAVCQVGKLTPSQYKRCLEIKD
jgi:ankyrin repeat protein